MYELLNHGLHSRRGLVRKGSAFLLQARKRLTGRQPAERYAAAPPVLANSFPKSGTHLLDQIVAGLPERVNYGAFLSSMTSSFQYRRRTADSTLRFIRASLPGEIVRAHLFYAPEFAAALDELNFVHYFIYRDPRDVVVSLSHFLRHMNPWHRLAKPMRALATDEAAMLAIIQGLEGGGPDAALPNIHENFRHYEGWLTAANVCPVRYEDLVGPARDQRIAEMAAFYQGRSAKPVDAPTVIERALAKIAPERSHTFRANKRGDWRTVFTPAMKDAFQAVAGDLLVRLGYERDDAW